MLNNKSAAELAADLFILIIKPIIVLQHTKRRPHYCTDALPDHIEFHYTLPVYPKIVVRMPPTIIEVVLTPSITRQNVMIILILLSFKFGHCECFFVMVLLFISDYRIKPCCESD